MICPLCKTNENNLSIVATGKEMRWDCWGHTDKFFIKCMYCGLIFFYPQWTQEELNKLYKNYLLEKDFSEQVQAKRISKYLKKFIKKEDIALEIGCGKAENVEYLNSNGYYVTGIEKDSHSHNPFVVNCDYKEFDPHIKYDFIYAIQVFEHIAEPSDFVNKIQDLLKPGSKFLLEIPNLEEPILSVWRVKEYQKFYNIPHHLYYWDPYTINLLFQKLGINIKIIRKQRYGILNHLRWKIFKKPGNWHPNIPIIDNIYKWVLINILHKSDTIIVIGEKK